ncbi:MAG: hypothetical protein CMN30_03820 [Sandaracinus sp.]|nr:hypothetical protein [Sandaracinus sp.]|tara:strand:- start:2641 stop:2979 length:339 start_codon:yes stop_codon:yes gene_type:complete
MSEKLRARIAALRAEYVAKLPSEAAAARAAFADQSGGVGTAVERCWQIVHRIHGTAGSHQIHVVADIARDLDGLLRCYRETFDPVVLPPEVASRVEADLERLEAQASLVART